MNCLYTVNIGSFMGSKARNSFLAARERWGCEYVELRMPCAPLFFSCAKFQGALHLSGFENLLYLDADVVVSESAPDPFKLISEPETLYVVSDYQPDNQTDEWRRLAFQEPCDRFIKQHPKLKIGTYEQFFNAGVFLFKTSNAMEYFFHYTLSSMPEEKEFDLGYAKYHEQAIFNLLAINSPEIELRYLPPEWNYMVRMATGPRSDCHINHYGGLAQCMIADTV